VVTTDNPVILENGTLTAGRLTVKLRTRNDRLVGIEFPQEPPAGLSREMLAGLEAALQVMPFELPAASPFTRRVWEILRQIPFGKTITYGELAARAGSPRGARAAGAACAANQLLLVVPCHRVVASNGLGGFALGLEWKRTLLALEAGRCSSDQSN